MVVALSSLMKNAVSVQRMPVQDAHRPVLCVRKHSVLSVPTKIDKFGVLHALPLESLYWYIASKENHCAMKNFAQTREFLNAYSAMNIIAEVMLHLLFVQCVK